ncbi:MAG: TRAP transporter substrate-binding protein [Gracilibacteraceae bacterium]|nr:TRAP transporter substrate-binding protein [Gracilibacteraceae bacterium]
MEKKINLFEMIRPALVALLVLSLIAITACSNSSPQTIAPAGGQNPEQITLKFQHHENPGSDGFQVLATWAALCEENAGGKLKIEIYPAQTLGKMTDAYDMVINGVADISWGFVPTFPGQFPITEGGALPMLGITSALQGSRVLQAMYDSLPEMQNEYKDVHVLFLHSHDPAPIGTAGKKIATMEDVKGLLLRVVGDGQTAMIKALGASPVPIALTDLYQSMSKGVVSGYALGWEGIESFKLPEVTDYILDCNYYTGGFWMLMNQKTWNSLPADIQEAFNSAGGMTGAEMFGRAWDEGELHGIEAALAANCEIVQLSDEETARWQELAKPLQEEWAAKLTAQGLDGTAVLQKLYELIDEYAE